MHQLWQELEKLKSYRWVDLSHSMNNDSPRWTGLEGDVLELGKVVYDWGNPILECQIQTFKFPGQFGTHVDFPGHFVQNRPLSDSFGIEHMMYPLCVIDITKQVAEDVHYAVTAADIQAYEAQHGAIPEGAFVALRTDWYKRWPDLDAFCNIDAEGGEHCPGWSLEALRYIYEVRHAAANGHETLDTDASMEAVKADDLACERYVLEQGKLQVEVMRNLDQVPPAGAILVMAWPKFEGATGLPVRAWAICEH